jgi:hypothetical protein
MKGAPVHRALPAMRERERTLDWRASPSAHQTRQQHHDEDNQEEEKQDLCNFRGSERDSTKAQKAGDNRDYQKDQRPIEHIRLR